MDKDIIKIELGGSGTLDEQIKLLRQIREEDTKNADAIKANAKVAKDAMNGFEKAASNAGEAVKNHGKHVGDTNQVYKQFTYLLRNALVESRALFESLELVSAAGAAAGGALGGLAAEGLALLIYKMPELIKLLGLTEDKTKDLAEQVKFLNAIYKINEELLNEDIKTQRLLIKDLTLHEAGVKQLTKAYEDLLDKQLEEATVGKTIAETQVKFWKDRIAVFEDARNRSLSKNNKVITNVFELIYGKDYNEALKEANIAKEFLKKSELDYKKFTNQIYEARLDFQENVKKLNKGGGTKSGLKTEFDAFGGEDVIEPTAERLKREYEDIYKIVFKDIDEITDNHNKAQAQRWIERFTETINNEKISYEQRKDLLEKFISEYDSMWDKEDKSYRKRFEDRQKMEAEQQKQQEEQTKQVMQRVVKFSEAMAQALQARIQGNIDIIDTQLQVTQKNIEINRELAQKGLNQDLAFQEQRQVELEKEKIKEQTRLRKAKELEIFLTLLAQFAQQNPNNATSKASSAMAGVKAGEAEYMEEGGIIGQGKKSQVLIGADKMHKGGGDVLLHAQKGEGVLSLHDMEMMKYGIFPKWLNSKVPNTKVLVPTISNQFDTSGIEKRLDSLEATIRNKREVDVNFDELGNMIVQQTEQGVKRITKHILSKK